MAPMLERAELREAQDLLFFAYRDFTNAADVVLADLGLGRAHHRALHFIGRDPGMTVTALLGILRITKQSLARVLGDLLERGYVVQAAGQGDRRQRRLSLTDSGVALEQSLFAAQCARIGPAYVAAGPQAVDGFRQVMRAIMEAAARNYLDRAKS